MTMTSKPIALALALALFALLLILAAASPTPQECLAAGGHLGYQGSTLFSTTSCVKP